MGAETRRVVLASGEVREVDVIPQDSGRWAASGRHLRGAGFGGSREEAIARWLTMNGDVREILAPGELTRAELIAQIEAYAAQLAPMTRAVDVLRAAAVAAGHPAADGDPDAQLCAVRAQAFREGAEAMREACVEELDSVRRMHNAKARDQKATIEDRAHAWERVGAIEDAAGEIEALPVPPCPEVSR